MVAKSLLDLARNKRNETSEPIDSDPRSNQLSYLIM